MSNVSHMSNKRACGPLSKALAGLLILAIGGCSLSAPYPNRAMFTINPGPPEQTEQAASAPAGAAHHIILRVRRIIAVAPYGGMAFVYQVGPHRVETDYYNAFAAPPADLLTGELVQWLRTTGICADVTDGSGTMASQWALEGRLQELAVDTSDASKPAAVMKLQLVLLDETGVVPVVILDKVYSESVSISATDAKSAADGWSAACRAAFTQFSVDLAAAPAAH
jgi:hypothetical protein